MVRGDAVAILGELIVVLYGTIVVMRSNMYVHFNNNNTGRLYNTVTQNLWLCMYVCMYVCLCLLLSFPFLFATVVLNRPKAFNALNLNMIRLLTPYYQVRALIMMPFLLILSLSISLYLSYLSLSIYISS